MKPAAHKRRSPPTVPDGPPSKRARVDLLSDNPLHFPREPSGTVQIATWNVASLETCNSAKWNFGFRKYVEAEDAHALSITEVNKEDAARFFENEPSFQFLRDRYPYRYWTKKTAILSKFAPIAPPIFGFPDGTQYDPVEGRHRAITLEFEELYLVSTYVQNSGSDHASYDTRKQWNADFEPFIRSLDAKKPVIWCGDFNVIRMLTPTANVTNDVQRWPACKGVAGTLPFEREAHERLLGDPGWLKNPKRRAPRFVDVWRLLHGEGWRQYTHESKHLGAWRLDGFIVSERFLHRVRNCKIRQAVKREFWPHKDVVKLGALSDHWPVWLSLEMERL